MAQGKTIQIYLPYGEPRGIRIADITTRIVQAIQVPRAKLNDFFDRDESSRIGVYFLLGSDESKSGISVYIGQTEDFKARLKKHHADKAFWQTAIILISRTQSFTQAHIKYLEWLSICSAQDAKRFVVQNSNQGSKPYVPEPMEADVFDAFETASTLIATLGFPIFDPLVSQNVQSQDIFYCKGPLAEASGSLTNDGFIVYAGSLARKQLVPSAQKIESYIAGLVEEGILVDENDQQYRVTRDYEANSPSYAAAMILGRHANGWIEWKRKDGSTLHDAYRVEITNDPDE